MSCTGKKYGHVKDQPLDKHPAQYARRSLPMVELMICLGGKARRLVSDGVAFEQGWMFRDIEW